MRGEDVTNLIEMIGRYGLDLLEFTDDGESVWVSVFVEFMPMGVYVPSAQFDLLEIEAALIRAINRIGSYPYTMDGKISKAFKGMVQRAVEDTGVRYVALTPTREGFRVGFAFLAMTIYHILKPDRAGRVSYDQVRSEVMNVMLNTTLIGGG